MLPLWYKSFMIKNAIIILFFAASAVCCFGQQKFPAWMDEVDMKSDSNRQGFNEPEAPIDPSTGQPSAGSRPPGSVFGKPRLPDFSKMREMALKTELERRAAAEGDLEGSFSASISNIEALKTEKAKLESLLAASPGQNEKQQLLAGIGELAKKLALSEEFVKLLDQNSTGSRQTPVASLTSTQFDRAIELQNLLFPGKSRQKAGNTGTIESQAPQKSTASSTEQVSAPAQMAASGSAKTDAETDTEDEPRLKPYRPGQIKSFYLESKKAQQQKQEADRQ